MGRIRTIKPEFPQSESMGRVCRESRLCFILLFTLADDAGRLRGNSRMLASLLYPYDDDAKKHIDTWLSELHREHCITRYEADGDTFIQLNKWLQHQKIDRPTDSKIKPPPDTLEDSTINREHSRENMLEGKGRDSIKEGNGVEIAPTGFVLPFWINADHWNTWHSCPKRKKANNAQKQMTVDKLMAWRDQGLDYAGALENAALGGYQGLFLPDEKKKSTSETPYQASMRKKYEQIAPDIAAKAPGVNPNTFFDTPLEITHAK